MVPISLWVNEDQPRAVPGGTGATKTGCNYPPAYAAQAKAKALGYDQVLWLDAIQRSFIEEVGTANVFFVYRDGTVATPKLRNEEIGCDVLAGTILPGITRDSVLKLLATDDARYRNHHGRATNLRIEDVVNDIASGEIVEAFASGTAAVIAPIGVLGFGNVSSSEATKRAVINENRVGPLTRALFDHLTGIQYGTEPDFMNWIEFVESSP